MPSTELVRVIDDLLEQSRRLREGEAERSLHWSPLAFEEGLSDEEFERAENGCGFTFAPDLRFFLARGLPTGDRFPDWRRGSIEELGRLLDAPIEGLEFDVEANALWLDAWGPRPTQIKDALMKVRDLAEQAPRMVPVHGHRYMSEHPVQEGLPVFSIMQSDIITYGNDLAEYLRHDFRFAFAEPAAVVSVQDREPPEIPFWSELWRHNNRP